MGIRVAFTLDLGSMQGTLKDESNIQVDICWQVRIYVNLRQWHGIWRRRPDRIQLDLER